MKCSPKSLLGFPPNKWWRVTQRKIDVAHVAHVACEKHLSLEASQISGDSRITNTLPETNIAHENPIFPGKCHQNGGLSMAMLVSWRVCHFLTCFCFQYSEKLLTSVAKSAVLTCTSKRPIISVSVVAKTRTNDIQGLRNIINTSILSISMPNKKYESKHLSQI